MGWLLDPEVDLVFLGFFVALLCFGVAALITAIADILPTINLAIIKIDLGGLFRSATQGIVNWLVGYAQSRVWAVENWFRGIAYDLTTLWNSTIGTLFTHSTYIQHLWDKAIPNGNRAAANTAIDHADFQLQLVRTEIHTAQKVWEDNHTYADAVGYINLEASAPSVMHAFLAAQARTLIASENHAQDLHDQLRDYIGRQITGQADVAQPYTGQTLSGVAGAIAIPGPIDLSGVDVQDIIKTGSQIAVGTAVAVIATKIVECLVSNCAGNNNFNNLLNDALGLLAAAEFADFVKNFVNDPSGTITSYTTKYDGLISAGEHDIDGVWTAIERALGI